MQPVSNRLQELGWGVVCGQTTQRQSGEGSLGRHSMWGALPVLRVEGPIHHLERRIPLWRILPKKEGSEVHVHHPLGRFSQRPVHRYRLQGRP